MPVVRTNVSKEARMDGKSEYANPGKRWDNDEDARRHDMENDHRTSKGKPTIEQEGEAQKRAAIMQQMMADRQQRREAAKMQKMQKEVAATLPKEQKGPTAAEARKKQGEGWYQAIIE